MSPSISWRLPLLLALGRAFLVGGQTCRGVLPISGGMPVSLVGATWNVPGDLANQLELNSDLVVARLKSRAYFADACSEGAYVHEQYRGMPLLGRTLRYTTNLAGAGCGCNAAVYLTSMKQNPLKSKCLDYYCDANNVCGVQCAEVDIQEANGRAWRSTLHAYNDSIGAGAGFGGSGPHRFAFSSVEYGPNAKCIDTSLPFDVAVSFPVDASGQLKAMEVILAQPGKPCDISFSVSEYQRMPEVSAALAAGMTPIISYWRSRDMAWLDGRGNDGPDCRMERPAACPESVSFYGFSVGPYVAPTPAPEQEQAPVPQSTFAPVPAPALRAPVTAPSMHWVPGAYPWAEVTRDGLVYYYNAKTQEVSWRLPAFYT